MRTLEGIRYLINWIVRKYNRTCRRSCTTGQGGVGGGHNLSIYMSRAELEEISEGLITAYANKFSNRVIQSIDIEHFITEFLMLRIEYASFAEDDAVGLVFWQMEQHHCWYIRTEKLFLLFSRKIPSQS